MGFLDTLSGIIIGAFLLTVAVKGNSKSMIGLAVRDKQFLQWAIAVGILLYLYSIPELRPLIGVLIAASFIGLGITSGTKIFSEGSKFWQSLGA